MPDYGTSFKGSYVHHSLNAGNAATMSAKENSREVRQSHFNLGSDGNFVDQARVLDKKANDIWKSPATKDRVEKINEAQ